MLALNRTTVDVIWKYVDGAHFFTSESPAAVGLCAAHPELEIAYKEVAAQLKSLYKFNYGLDTTFMPSIPLDSFKELVESTLDKAQEYVDQSLLVPSNIQPWTLQGAK